MCAAGDEKGASERGFRFSILQNSEKNSIHFNLSTQPLCKLKYFPKILPDGGSIKIPSIYLQKNTCKTVLREMEKTMKQIF